MPELNIHQRLLEVRKSVKPLSKDAKNTNQNFEYVSSSNVLGSLKAEMDKQGLLLVPSVESSEVRPHTTKSGGNWFFTILNMVYTWVNVDDPKDIVVCKWIGCGLDSSELGIGKAQTYSEKYFLLKFFNIPTDGDDPDSGAKVNSKSTTTKSQPQGATPKDSPDEAMKKLDFIAKIMGNAVKATGLQCPADATQDVKNKACGDIVEQWTTYELKDKETGKMKKLPTARGNADLKNFSLKRLQATYGTSKKDLEGMGTIPEAEQPELSGEDPGLPF